MKRFIHLLVWLLPVGVAAQSPETPLSGTHNDATIPAAEAPAAVRNATHPCTEECPIRAAFAEPLSVVPLTTCDDSYIACRRMLGEDLLPAPDEIHVEELVNHFDYGYPAPADGAPLTLSAEIAPCPWNEAHWLVRFGIRLRDAADSAALPLRHAGLHVEFNPTQVAAYRMVGNDTHGEPTPARRRHERSRHTGHLDAGSRTTVLYELIPAGEEPSGEQEAALKLQSREGVPVVLIPSTELLSARLRYRTPGCRRGRQTAVSLRKEQLQELTGDFAFAAAVAMYGQLLRNSEFRGDASWGKVLSLAEAGLADDPDGQRHEFIALVRMAQILDSHR